MLRICSNPCSSLQYFLKYSFYSTLVDSTLVDSFNRPINTRPAKQRIKFIRQMKEKEKLEIIQDENPKKIVDMVNHNWGKHSKWPYSKIPFPSLTPKQSQLISFHLDDIIITRFPNEAVKISHQPTGCQVICSLFSNNEKNTQIAKKRLLKKLQSLFQNHHH